MPHPTSSASRSSKYLVLVRYRVAAVFLVQCLVMLIVYLNVVDAALLLSGTL